MGIKLFFLLLYDKKQSFVGFPNKSRFQLQKIHKSRYLFQNTGFN